MTILRPSDSSSGVRNAADFEKHRWTIVATLCALFALSFIDRYIPALLAEPISHTLTLTDKQMALLLGGGFSLIYSISGVPIARLIDHGERRRIVAVGVLLWSGCTMMSAFASNFPMLLILRAGVAIGEAVLTPAAVSMIADMFDRRERGLPTSLYISISGIMASGSFIVGAAILDFSTAYGATIPLEPWRLTMLLVGVPGLIFAAIIGLTLPEPRRAVANDQADATNLLPFLRSHAGVFLPYYLAIGLTGMMSFAVISWGSTLLVRTVGLSPSVAGYYYGVVGVPMSLLGTFMWPWIATRWREGSGRALFQTAAICVAIGGASLMALPFVTGLYGLLACLGFAAMSLFSIMVMAALLVQRIGPPTLRGRLAALNLLSLNIIGYTSGPLIVAFVADGFERTAGIAHGMAAVALIAAPLAIIGFLIAARASGTLRDTIH